MPVTALKNNMEAEIRTRVTSDLKTEAVQILNSCGLNVSDAVRLFLTQVVTHRGLPFEIKIPNATTVAAMKESRKLVSAKAQSFDSLINELEKK
ncbi:type II toxin-antitoxin system RelB/DinJ family antitoxin [Polynucleobacter sp. 31A-FELB]|uniref:type II toxin-antitoxin system RelB/DinJ family antitoxin n=1 Tax=Polynucleobacter sp. 31A-FELB TaxID=2689096 RepID=UPI001D78BC24|nr:type II toxin-antitoxin system RelB/DinJ family antitoxin [Polynucleobacter sp. 31A-FELB]MBU3587800.1 type II toxin-antitoxin system RelB/DinJ family antitoxin [Polynucleobacter sp. 31A-FELB]